jgi:hypothetical protein
MASQGANFNPRLLVLVLVLVLVHSPTVDVIINPQGVIRHDEELLSTPVRMQWVCMSVRKGCSRCVCQSGEAVGVYVSQERMQWVAAAQGVRGCSGYLYLASRSGRSISKIDWTKIREAATYGSESVRH